MNQENPKCMRPGHEDLRILGTCVDASCQADQKKACLLCLLAFHAECEGKFIAQPCMQTFEVLMEQFEENANETQNKVDGIGCIYQCCQEQNSLSTKGWISGYKLITYQVLDALQSTQDLILQIQTKHKISTIALSPDGKYIASAGYGYDYSIQIWDLITTKQVGNALKGHKKTQFDQLFKMRKSYSIGQQRQYYPTVEFTQSNRNRLTDYWTLGCSLDSLICSRLKAHYFMLTRQDYQILELQNRKRVDQKLIISCSLDKTIRFWNSKTGSECLDKQLKNPTAIWSLCLSPSYGIFGDTQGRIRIFNYERHRRQQFLGHRRCVISLHYSADGQSIVSSGDENSIKVWDRRSTKQIRSCDGHTSFILSVGFSPDMRYIVSGSNDQTIRLWNRITGSQIGDPLAHFENPASQAQFSLDGKCIVTGSGTFLGIMVAPIDL